MPFIRGVLIGWKLPETRQVHQLKSRSPEGSVMGVMATLQVVPETLSSAPGLFWRQPQTTSPPQPPLPKQTMKLFLFSIQFFLLLVVQKSERKMKQNAEIMTLALW